MFGLSNKLNTNKKEKKPFITEIADEAVTALAVTAGAVLGLTSKESEAYVKDTKKIEEVADRVAIAEDLRTISRQQDGLTEKQNADTARAATKKQQAELDIKTD